MNISDLHGGVGIKVLWLDIVLEEKNKTWVFSVKLQKDLKLWWNKYELYFFVSLDLSGQ